MTDNPPNGCGNENEREGGGESARTEEDSKATQIILSAFRFEREQSNFTRVSETAQLFRILVGISPLFFSLFFFLFFLFLSPIHPVEPRTNEHRQVYRFTGGAAVYLVGDETGK